MKNKGIGIILLLLGGYAAYYLLKKKKPTTTRRGSVVVDPLDKGEFPDDKGDFPSDYDFPLIPKGYTTEQIAINLNSQMQPNPSILSQIQNMNRVENIGYQTYYGQVSGHKIGVPNTI